MTSSTPNFLPKAQLLIQSHEDQDFNITIVCVCVYVWERRGGGGGGRHKLYNLGLVDILISYKGILGQSSS